MTHTEHPVLLTGFAPFDGETVNPSWEAVRQLDGATIADHPVVACELPCDFRSAPAALNQAIDASRPALVLAVGLAGGRAGISLERVAINLLDARIPDNTGQQPIDEPVVPGGVNAHFSSLPLKACLAALHAADLPARVSQTAGTYVCNQIFYLLMQRLAGSTVRGGFVHVPWSPEQAERHGEPGMTRTDSTQALKRIVHTGLTTVHDAHVAAGAEH